MDMHHIRYFLAVCETLNFTRAAEKCNVTQPALSRAIQQLEEEVGGLVFRRERNLTHLTDLGALLKPRFEQILDNADLAKVDAHRFLTLQQANVTLGIMCTIGPTRFTGLLGALKKNHPGIQLRLIEGVPAQLNEQLANGEIDVAIMSDPQGANERFDKQALYSERFVLAAPVGHRFEAMSEVPIAEVQGENYLRRLNCEYRDHLKALCDERNVGVHVCYASEREDWIQNMVASGLGICFIPEFSAVLPGIVTRPVVEPEVYRDISLVTVCGRRYSPAVATFLRMVREYRWTEGIYQIADCAA